MRQLPGILGAHAMAGTPGTCMRDSRIASLVLALLAAACGGESEKSGSDDSSSSSSSSSTAGGGASSGGSSSTANTDGTACSGGDAIDPGCFGSPGPVTNGSTASVGTGGSTNGSTDTTTSANSGGSAGAACQPQDVSGAGECAAAFGVFFLGERCGWLSGCNCVGEDCDDPYDDEASCEAAHRECLAPDCAPQDISYVGDCDPASVYVFNGIECAAMEGCSCVGNDCDARFTSLEACVAAYATCTERESSCDELEAAYGNYVGHTTCQDDGDCVVVEGLCAADHGCAHVVNRHWGKAGIDAYTEAWNAAGCPQVDCDCDVPESAVCSAGVCTEAK